MALDYMEGLLFFTDIELNNNTISYYNLSDGSVTQFITENVFTPSGIAVDMAKQ